MDDSVVQFYDRLSGDYHLIFEDWPTSIRRQAEVLDRLLREQVGGPPVSVLDCCCGIGTQAIGLALRGYRVQGTDLSPEAIERATREAAAFGVTIPFAVADVRTLAEQVEGTFDAVLACDNSLPHLLTDDDLRRGIGGMASRLRPGGVFLASTRDYDALVRDRQRATLPRVFEDSTGRRVVFQVWDWNADGKGYKVNQFILKEADSGWQTAHYASQYRALLREEFSQALHQVGLTDVHWHMPEESGYYQPIVTARRPG
jgi:SAM-dependent methyltransferase